MSFSGIYLPDTPVIVTEGNTGNLLLRKIQKACRMSLPEPDLSSNLDVADYINSKQGSSPRDAAVAIVRLINSRGTHTAVFALCLLDVLVKNCGYPIHLQISRKEFLNELVKRFPEHPPLRYTKVQRLILTAIEEWYQTICKDSNYQEDMKYIRDMHNLLRCKGYVFPRINQEDLAVLRPSDHLKTPKEIQKEQEVAQAAKLEELIRRGKPEDLKEANRLMKVMAGFKQDNTIYAKNAMVDEITKLKRKANLFSEMLNACAFTDSENETMLELYSSLKSSQPKFQEIINDETTDDDFVKDLLYLNDSVNQLIQRYNILKTGNPGETVLLEPHLNRTASSMKPRNSVNVTESSTTLAHEINLIDFREEDDETTSVSENFNKATIDDILDELNGFRFSQSPSDYGVGGKISFSTTNSPAPTQATYNHNTFGLFGDNVMQSANQDSTLMNLTQDNNKSAEISSGNNLSNLSNQLEYQVTGSVKKENPEISLINLSANIKLEFRLERLDDSKVKITFYFSNVTLNEIKNLTFMVAVPKSCSLKLLPQSGDMIPANTNYGITQEARVEHPIKENLKPLKVKWKIIYTMNESACEDASIFTLPSI